MSERKEGLPSNREWQKPLVPDGGVVRGGIQRKHGQSKLLRLFEVDTLCIETAKKRFRKAHQVEQIGLEQTTNKRGEIRRGIARKGYGNSSLVRNANEDLRWNRRQLEYVACCQIFVYCFVCELKLIARDAYPVCDSISLTTLSASPAGSSNFERIFL
jgi:hypothetical protein